jgi:flagellin-like hook-associated protein FlgL
MSLRINTNMSALNALRNVERACRRLRTLD